MSPSHTHADCEGTAWGFQSENLLFYGSFQLYVALSTQVGVYLIISNLKLVITE